MVVSFELWFKLKRLTIFRTGLKLMQTVTATCSKIKPPTTWSSGWQCIHCIHWRIA